jgi:ATP-dependent Lon protease
MKEVLLSRENKKHVEEIKREYIKDLEFVYVDKMEDVLNHALGVWSF